MKESMLTAPLTKLAALHRDAVSEGQAQLSELTDKWCQGLTVAKSFLKAYRELQKSKNKDDKLLGMAGLLRSVASFLKEHAVPYAPSLSLLNLKAQFLDGMSRHKEDGLVMPAFGPLLELELAAVLADQAGDDASNGFSPDGWLRSMLMGGFAQAIGHWTEFAKGSLEAWLGDVARVRSSVSLLGAGINEQSTVVAELACLETILSSAMEPPATTASKVSEAMRLLKDSRSLEGVLAALQRSVGGGAILQAASNLMVRSAGDEAGDNRLKNAMSVLRSNGVLTWTVVSDTPGAPAGDGAGGDSRSPGRGDIVVFKATETVKTGVLAEILRESMQSVVEAFSLWSRAGQEDAKDELQGWFAHLLGLLSKADEYLTYHMYMQIGNMGLRGLLSGD